MQGFQYCSFVFSLLAFLVSALLIYLNVGPFGEFASDGDASCRMREALYWWQYNELPKNFPPGGLDWLPLPFYLHIFFWRLGFDFVTAAQVFPLLCGIASVLLMMMIVWKISSRWDLGAFSGLLLASHYTFVKVSTIPMSEGPILFCLLLTLYLLLAQRFVGAGLVLFIGSFIRFEIWVLSFLVVLWLVVRHHKEVFRFDAKFYTSSKAFFPLLAGLGPLVIMIWSLTLQGNPLFGVQTSFHDMAAFTSSAGFDTWGFLYWSLEGFSPYAFYILVPLLMIAIWRAPIALSSFLFLSFTIIHIISVGWLGMVPLPRYFLLNYFLAIVVLVQGFPLNGWKLLLLRASLVLMILLQSWNFYHRMDRAERIAKWPESIQGAVERNAQGKVIAAIDLPYVEFCRTHVNIHESTFMAYHVPRAEFTLDPESYIDRLLAESTLHRKPAIFISDQRLDQERMQAAGIQWVETVGKYSLYTIIPLQP